MSSPIYLPLAPLEGMQYPSHYTFLVDLPEFIVIFVLDRVLDRELSSLFLHFKFVLFLG